MKSERDTSIPSQDAAVTEQQRVDEAMLESFPASDPPSWNAGISHEQAHISEAPSPARPAWKRVKRTLMQAFTELTDDDFICQEGQERAVLTRIAQRLNNNPARIEHLLLT